MKRIVFLVCMLVVPLGAQAGWNSDFTVHKLGTGAPVVLIVGGIQGDEPGGFSAAALLASQYEVSKGSVWVVPNLNFPSIIKRHRGLHGDMNRKFATLPESDPEYQTVRRIQDIIRHPDVALVLNLHDGSGFYRPKYEDKLRNPNRWGQAVIIDQHDTGIRPYGDLEACARQVVDQVNTALLQEGHRYFIKNTRTDEGDPEMEKCLTWFALGQGKPAFGLEVSKEFTTEGRTYYHLNTVEAFLSLAGIEFSRTFPLTFKGVRAALQSDIDVAFAEKRVRIPLENVRPRLSGFIPLPRNVHDDVAVSKPILAVIGEGSEMSVHYGNRLLTKFRPEWYDQFSEISEFHIAIDGQPVTVTPGELVAVGREFMLEPREGFRFRAIGTGRGGDESGVSIRKQDFRPEYSLDTGNSVFRVEAYAGDSFAGMFLVRFGEQQTVANRKFLPGIAGVESELGR